MVTVTVTFTAQVVPSPLKHLGECKWRLERLGKELLLACESKLYLPYGRGGQS